MGEALIVRRGGGGTDLSGATVTSSGDWKKGIVVLSGANVNWDDGDCEIGTAVIVDGVCIYNDFDMLPVNCTSTHAGWGPDPNDEVFLANEQAIRIAF